MGLPKPTDSPIWGTNLGVRTDPGLAKQQTGWVFQEAPPASVMNFIQGVQGDMLRWLSERFDDGANSETVRMPPIGAVGVTSYLAQFDASGLRLVDDDLHLINTGNGGELKLSPNAQLEFINSGVSRFEFQGVPQVVRGPAFASVRNPSGPSIAGEVSRRNTIACAGTVNGSFVFSSYNISSIDTNVDGLAGRYRINFDSPIQTISRVVLVNPLAPDRFAIPQGMLSSSFNANSQVIDIENGAGTSVAAAFSFAIIGA